MNNNIIYPLLHKISFTQIFYVQPYSKPHSYGQQIMGTPVTKLSKVEFHSLLVKNPPIALCATTFSCGAQYIMNPLSLILSFISIDISSSIRFFATMFGHMSHVDIFLTKLTFPNLP